MNMSPRMAVVVPASLARAASSNTSTANAATVTVGGAAAPALSAATAAALGVGSSCGGGGGGPEEPRSSTPARLSRVLSPLKGRATRGYVLGGSSLAGGGGEQALSQAQQQQAAAAAEAAAAVRRRVERHSRRKLRRWANGAWVWVRVCVLALLLVWSSFVYVARTGFSSPPNTHTHTSYTPPPPPPPLHKPPNRPPRGRGAVRPGGRTPTRRGHGGFRRGRAHRGGRVCVLRRHRGPAPHAVYGLDGRGAPGGAGPVLAGVLRGRRRQRRGGPAPPAWGAAASAWGGRRRGHADGSAGCVLAWWLCMYVCDTYIHVGGSHNHHVHHITPYQRPRRASSDWSGGCAGS